ncbi:MAG: hypothetical protein IPM63_03975 [Acidobacteriota bacterium]|nr:MAG: hypothetical protein IPM63_03975 [Acidobacteriota bacterium]
MTNDQITWPELPESGYLSDRTATVEDIDNGVAVFALQDDQGHYEGELVDITIPQYAFHIDEDTKEESPVIIVQAETNGEFIAIGYRYVIDGSLGVGLQHEFEFLGTKRPRTS